MYLFESGDAEFGEWENDSEKGVRHYIEKVNGKIEIQKGQWVDDSIKYFVDQVTDT